MKFYNALKQKVRDKTRDKLFKELCSIGFDAQLVERGQIEESIVWSDGEKSLGLIEVRDSPIRWINVCKKAERESWGAKYTNIYLIPDIRIINKGYLEAKSIREKSIPLVGGVTGIHWKGNLKTDLIKRLNEDTLLTQRLIRLNEEIKIRNSSSCGCWVISSNQFKEKWPNLWQPVSLEQWYCYETIARHLLTDYSVPF